MKKSPSFFPLPLFSFSPLPLFSFSPLLLFSFSPLLLLSLSLLLLAACTPAQPVEPTAPDALPSPASTESLPTEIPPTDTLPAPASPTPLPPVTPTPLSPATSSALQIAFTNAAADIVLWQEPDNTLIPLVPASGAVDIRLSDDGTMLAYRKSIDTGQQEIWAVNTDGTGHRMLLSVDDLRALDPDALGVTPYQFEWIPGTHTLAFNTLQYVEGPGLFLYDELHFLEVDPNEPTNQLTTQLPPGSGGNFVFSPDGLQYALVKPESISLLNTDGTNIRSDVLTYPYVLTYSEYQYYAEPVWSPDSTFLRVAIPPQEPLGAPAAPTTLWEIPTDGSPAIQTGAVLAQPFFVDPVRFSPDLSHVAYTRLIDPDDFVNAELVIANADGSGEVVYETGNLFFTGWAPDSQHFVFENGAVPETYLGQTGGDYAPLTDIPYTRDVYWVDDMQFFFIAQSGEGWQIRLGAVGEASTVIADLPGAFPGFDFDK